MSTTTELAREPHAGSPHRDPIPARRAAAGASFDALLRAIAEAPSVRPRDLDLVGRTIGRYTVERRLGQGGMGVVYEARHRELGRRVALKVLRASDRGSEVTRARLLAEARRLAALQHPNIATVYDAGEHDGIVFLALERAGGRTLRARLAEPAPIALPRAAAILRAIAAGLACAHDAGIVHRDLKPENVVVDGDAVKLIDFGVAALAGTDAAPAGTRRYMAPEIIAGGPVTPRADVFAFGGVARELLASSVVRLRDRRAGAALRRLAAACTSDAPDARPRDGAALVEALEGILAPAQGSSTALLVGIGAAAAAAGLLLARAVPAPPPEPAGAPTRAPLAVERPARWSDTSLAVRGPEDAPRRSPAGGLAAPWLPRGADAAPRDAPLPAGEERGDVRLEDPVAAGGVLAAGAAPPRGAVGAPVVRASELPVTAFVDESGRLIVRLDGYGAIAGATAGRGLAHRGVPLFVAEPSVKMLVDGKGGAILQVTLQPPPPADSSPGPAASKPPGPAGVIAPGALPVLGAAASRDSTSKGGLHLLDTAVPQTEDIAVQPGSGAAPWDAPVRHFFCADFEVEEVRVVHAPGGHIELTTGGGGADGAARTVLAVIDVTGEVVETGDGVSMCGAVGEPLSTFDG